MSTKLLILIGLILIGAALTFARLGPAGTSFADTPMATLLLFGIVATAWSIVAIICVFLLLSATIGIYDSTKDQQGSRRGVARHLSVYRRFMYGARIKTETVPPMRVERDTNTIAGPPADTVPTNT